METSPQNTLTELSRIMFNQISRHCGPVELTHKVHYHRVLISAIISRMQYCFWFTPMTWGSGCVRYFSNMIVLILLVKEQSESNFNEWYTNFFLLRMSKMTTNWVYGPSGPTVSEISARIAYGTGFQSPNSNMGLWWHFRFIDSNVS